MTASNTTPSMVALSDVPALEGEASPVGIRLHRMITPARCGSDVLTGIAKMHPQEQSSLFSYQEQNAQPGQATHYGPVEQTFFVMQGALTIAWEDGEMTAVAQQALHLPPGHVYRMINRGDSEMMAVYTIAPIPAV